MLNNIIKFMPIDKTSMDMLSPIIDFTSTNNDNSFMESFNNVELEIWAPKEIALFESCLCIFGKNFSNFTTFVSILSLNSKTIVLSFIFGIPKPIILYSLPNF